MLDRRFWNLELLERIRTICFRYSSSCVQWVPICSPHSLICSLLPLLLIFFNIIFMFASFDKKKIQQIRHAMLYRDWKLFCCHDYFWVRKKKFCFGGLHSLVAWMWMCDSLIFWYETEEEKKKRTERRFRCTFSVHTCIVYVGLNWNWEHYG